MSTVAIVQARMGSTRLPNKVMLPVCGVPLIELLVARLALSQRVDRIILATSDAPADQPLVDWASRAGVEVFRGSERDVLDRFYQAARAAKARTVVRITGDCPLVDPQLVDATIDLLRESRADYADNTDPPSFPDGLDVEVVRMEALERAWREATAYEDREHVTPYIRRSPGFRLASLRHEHDYSAERWTIDEPEDLDVIRRIFEHFHPRRDFGWTEIVQLRAEHPAYFEANRHVARDEGARMGTGQKLWRRAQRVIPGGGMLLSKRAEQFLPGRWPAYFSRASGCRVWDLDGNEYLDVSAMGLGTNTLGYGHADVDAAVRRVIDTGNMSTLNGPEEVTLAERLVALHPWAEMAFFARTGGEANAASIRIARAATGRARVAVCGYHGWHDWYLAGNLRDEQGLAEHLFPDLPPRGVPDGLRDTVQPFRYNRFDELVALMDAHPDIGVIKMEVSRSEPPADGFLQSVRELATRRGAVLVFDECTSGFRETFGGLHLKYGVEPDLAVFGKALGNGYAITAVIGRRAVMESAQRTFLSSTFWTERIGPVAALATLDVMERARSWEQISAIGRRVKQSWREIAQRHGVRICVAGLDAIPELGFEGPNQLAYKTLITQELLARGFLASTLLYASLAHETAIVDRYLAVLDPVFSLLRECQDGRDPHELLQGPVCQAGLPRVN